MCVYIINRGIKKHTDRGLLGSFKTVARLWEAE